MYDTPPNYGFPGSSIPQLPTVLDNINPAYYQQIAAFIAAQGGRLASVAGVVLYDTVRVDAGVLTTKDFVFFQNPVGVTQGLFVAGTQYAKKEIDVHPWVSNGGQLSQGYEALIWSIGVQFHTVAAPDATLNTGDSINLTLTPGVLSGEAVTAVQQANVMRAFQEGLFFKLFVNQTDFESGPGWRFPAGPYGSGGGIGLAGVAAAPLADGTITNGFGLAYQMPVMRHIPSLTKFGVRMSVQNAFSLVGSTPVRIVVTLEGIGLQPITG